MNNEDTIRWEVRVRAEEGEIFMEGAAPDGRTYVWVWDFQAWLEGPEFITVNGGALEHDEFPPHGYPPRPSAAVMVLAEEIRARLDEQEGPQ